MGQNVFLSEGTLVSEDGTAVEISGGGGSGDEIVGQSLVSGSLAVPGGSVAAGDAFEGTPGVYFYAGGVDVGPTEPWTVDGTSGDITGMYLVGVETNISARSITISGATGIPGSLQAANLNIAAGDAVSDVTVSENTFRAGTTTIRAGDAHNTDDGLNGVGGAIIMRRATAVGTGVGGNVEITGGNGTDTGGSVTLVAGSGTTPGSVQVTLTGVGAPLEMGVVGAAPAIGFLGASPAVRQSHITDADLTDVHTKFNSLLDKLEAYGLLESS